MSQQNVQHVTKLGHTGVYNLKVEGKIGDLNSHQE